MQFQNNLQRSAFLCFSHRSSHRHSNRVNARVEVFMSRVAHSQLATEMPVFFCSVHCKVVGQRMPNSSRSTTPGSSIEYLSESEELYDDDCGSVVSLNSETMFSDDEEANADSLMRLFSLQEASPDIGKPTSRQREDAFRHSPTVLHAPARTRRPPCGATTQRQLDGPSSAVLPLVNVAPSS